MKSEDWKQHNNQVSRCLNAGTCILEVDEGQHEHYPVLCECARTADILTEQIKRDKGGQIHMIRFNPDAFTEDGVLQKVTQKVRHQRLLEAIGYKSTKPFEITYLYYTRSDCPLPDICFGQEYCNYLRALVNPA